MPAGVLLRRRRPARVKVESSGSSAGGTGQFYLNPAYSTTPVGAGGEGQLYETLDGAGTASVGHAGMAMASSAVRGGAVGGGQAAVVSAVGAAVPTQRATVLHVGGDDYDNVGRDAPLWPRSDYETVCPSLRRNEAEYDLGSRPSNGFGFDDNCVYDTVTGLAPAPVYDLGTGRLVAGPVAPVYDFAGDDGDDAMYDYAA